MRGRRGELSKHSQPFRGGQPDRKGTHGRWAITGQALACLHSAPRVREGWWQLPFQVKKRKVNKVQCEPDTRATPRHQLSAELCMQLGELYSCLEEFHLSQGEDQGQLINPVFQPEVEEPGWGRRDLPPGSPHTENWQKLRELQSGSGRDPKSHIVTTSVTLRA